MNPKFKKIIIIVTIIVGVLFWAYFIVNVYELKNNKHLSWKNYVNNYHRQPVLIKDISSWMTFDYLNKVFNLPPTYLKQTLGINDKKYPVLTIGQYAKKTKTDTSMLVFSVQDAIKTYLTTSTPE